MLKKSIVQQPVCSAHRTQVPYGEEEMLLKKNVSILTRLRYRSVCVVFFVVEMSEIERDKESTMLVTCKSTVFTRDTSLITLGY